MNIFNLNLEMIGMFFFAGLCGLLIKICLSYSDQKWADTFHYTLTFILLPVIFIFIFYLYLFVKSKFKISHL